MFVCLRTCCERQYCNLVLPGAYVYCNKFKSGQLFMVTNDSCLNLERVSKGCVDVELHVV